MNKLIVKAPINDTSIGNVSINILRELFKKDIRVSLFPIQNNMDVRVFDKLQPEFKNWLKSSFDSRLRTIDSSTPTLQVWHLNGSESKLSDRSFLYTFYETDSPTFTESKLCSLHEKVFFSSSHATNCFRKIGCENVAHIPLGFDQDFYETKKEYIPDKLHFGLMGKFEKRKHTERILNLWAKHFGDEDDFQLSCAVMNRFLPPEQMNQCISRALEGKNYENINFLPFLETNSQFNELLNSIDIDLTGLSGAEGWNLPSFNASCLGKWSCVLNATSHKDWATESNSFLIEPEGSSPIYDGVFFLEGSDFNQGNHSTFSNDTFTTAMVRMVAKGKNYNTEGVKLKDKFSYERCVNSILENIL